MSSDGPAIEVAQEALEEKLDKLDIGCPTIEAFVEPLRQLSTRRTKSRQQRMFDEERRKQWEEAQANKPVLETGVEGAVKWYSVLGHYGFISRDDKGKDVFVHQSAISKSKIEKYFLRTLGDEERVVFDVVKGEKGPEAANVTGPGGAEVIGSKYFRIQLYRFRLNSRKAEESVGEFGETKSKSTRPRVRKHKNREFRRKINSNESEAKEGSGGRRRRATDEPELEKTTIENFSAGDAGLGAQSVERQSLVTN